MDEPLLRQTVRDLLPETARFLSGLIAIPSTPGREAAAVDYAAAAFAAAGAAVERVPLRDSLRGDPDYSDPVPDIAYDGRCNLRLVRRGAGGGRRLLLNTHLDVVPPSEGMDDPWSGRVENGVVHGRGACDAKGQAATVYLVLRALDALGAETAGDLVAHLVNEEENGGNGSLAMVRRGEQADGCVVLEPTDGRLFTSIRGAVWFRLTCAGRAGHSGQAGHTRSALLLARDAIGRLEDFHADLLRRSRGFPLFDPHPNPMPLTLGRLQAGNWPAAAPSRAVLEGVLGFLPNQSKEDVCDGLRDALAETLPAGSFDLHFMYRHDCSVVDPAHPLPRALLAAAAAAAVPLEVGGMTASCDAWFYNNQLGIPTVVYGPGTLKVAHARDEHIRLDDIAAAAEVLVRLAAAWGRETA